MKSHIHDVIIVGGGVSGTSLLYTLARYTDVRSVALIEKYDELAALNSSARANSQTLHCGDIETNYTLEKALKVKRAALMLRNYAVAQPDRHYIIDRYPKMVIGVGESECELLRRRFDQFSPHYPKLRQLDRKAIAKIEPAVAMGDKGFRREKIIALGTTDEYCAVNFQALTLSFMRQAKRLGREHPEKHVDINYKSCVRPRAC